MYQISDLIIYPIKSINGISLSEVSLSYTGLELDRRWMLIGEDNTFISQRRFPKLALFRLTIRDDLFIIHHLEHPDQSLAFSYKQYSTESIDVTIWEDTCKAFVVSEEINNWFSSILDFGVRLVYMPDSTKRKVDPDFAVSKNDIISFSDAYPILMLSEGSLELLNSKLTEPIGFDRFRPNMVIKGLEPHEEDQITEFKIGDHSFYGVKPCARCIMTTIDQETAKSGKEPLQTLASYRSKNNKIYFGQNVIGPEKGTLKKGDVLTILKRSYS